MATSCAERVVLFKFANHLSDLACFGLEGNEDSNASQPGNGSVSGNDFAGGSKFSRVFAQMQPSRALSLLSKTH